MSATFFYLVLYLYGQSGAVMPIPYTWEDCNRVGEQTVVQVKRKNSFAIAHFVCVERGI